MGTAGYSPPPYGSSWPSPPEPKPAGAFVVSLVGGVFILLGGLLELWIGYLTSSFVAYSGLFAPYGLLGLIGVGLGVLVIAFSMLLYVHPQHHAPYGVLILVLSLVSVVSFWGLDVGLILGIVGGALAVVWTPYRPMAFTYAPMSPGGWPYGPGALAPPSLRVCLKCGRMAGLESRFCPFCGTPMPS